jgi:hypothetical protein
VRTAILIATLAAASAASADVTFTIETRSLQQESAAVDTQQVRATADKLVMDGKQDDGSYSVIFRGDRQTFYHVQHADKSYVELDKATAEKLGGRLQEAMQSLEAKMEKLSPEQRAQVEAMMGKTPVAPTSQARELRPTGAKRDVDGIPCTQWEIWAGPVKESEAWVAKWKDVGLDPKAFAVFESMGRFFEASLASVPGLAGVADENRIFADLERLAGLPLIMRDFEDGEPIEETRIRDWRSARVDASAFELPAGYRRQDVPSME